MDTYSLRTDGMLRWHPKTGNLVSPEALFPLVQVQTSTFYKVLMTATSHTVESNGSFFTKRPGEKSVQYSCKMI